MTTKTRVELAVAFESMPNLKIVHLGLLWASVYRDEFPIPEDLAPVDMPIEHFGRAASRGRSNESALPRLQCWSENRTSYVEIQNNRFAISWLSSPEGQGYPGYPDLRSGFESQFQRYIDQAEANHWGEVNPTQCQLTYFNHIPYGTERRPDFVDMLVPQRAVGALSPPESMHFQVQYVLHDGGGSPIGRAHISAEPARSPRDDGPTESVTMQVRGQPLGSKLGGVLAFFDLGHGALVSAFDDITSPMLHRLWTRVPDRSSE